VRFQLLSMFFSIDSELNTPAAPETWAGKDTSNLGEKSDVYSFGILMHVFHLI
jgi:hypothetical protein